MVGSAGFSRLVAVKQLHPNLAANPDFVAMLLDEARVAAHIHHVNVIDTLDLFAKDGAFGLVLEYIEGDSLAALVRSAAADKEPVPRPVAIAIISGVLRGLDAAHEVRDEQGEPLHLVHRDVSPQNVLVGVDGIARLIDFGVAKALGRYTTTGPGEVRGKLSYMAPEQVRGQRATRQSDVYAAGVILWELLTGRRLFHGEVEAQVLASALRGDVPAPSSIDPEIPIELDAVVRRATASDVGERYLTAREMNADLTSATMALPEDVGAWVRRTAASRLAERRKLIEQSAAGSLADAKPMADVLAELEVSDRTQWEAPLTFVEAPKRRTSKRWLALAAPLMVLGIGAPWLWARSRHAPASGETMTVFASPSGPNAPASLTVTTPDPTPVTASASASATAFPLRTAPPVPRPGVRPSGTTRPLDPKSYR
jgi:serine/threonine-protein kinase